LSCSKILGIETLERRRIMTNWYWIFYSPSEH
jgi:hypothetical protein